MERLPKVQTARAAPPAGPPPIDCAGFPGFGQAEAANDVRMAQLARTIEEEIIPRLMLAHRSSARVLAAAGDEAAVCSTVTDHDVKQFAQLALSHDEDIAFRAIHELRQRQVSVESIYLDLLAPTARYLGRLWEEDLCSFTDVTVGLGRLQRVLRELSPSLTQKPVGRPLHGRRILLLPSPGEQHTFGLVMVGEFFRQAGWDVVGGAWAASTDAGLLVAAEWFDVVGFSLAGVVKLPDLQGAIKAVRHATCNESLVVLVGGPLFGLQPELADVAGADGMTIDGSAAPTLAESLVARCESQHAAHNA